MSSLKEAILKAQRAAASNVAPLATSVVADGLIIHPGRNVEVSKSQLAVLRRKFENTVVGRTRFEDGSNYVRWGGQTKVELADVDVSASVQQVKPVEHSPGVRSVVTPKTKLHKKKEDWKEKLHADLTAVCVEAGLTPRASAAVVRAAEKGIITGNPGVLLCLLVRFQCALEGPLGKRQAMLLLQTAPILLNTSPDSLAWHLEELVEIFDHKAAVDMVSKQPLLLSCNPFSVWTNLEALRSMLGTSMDKVQHMVSRQPRLLLVSPAALAQRMTDFRDLMSSVDLGNPALRKLLISQPALLTYHSPTLAQNIDQVMSMLDLDQEQVCRLISKTPSLVMLNPATLVGKIEDLAGLLHTSCQEAVKIIARQPSVLCVSSQLLHAKVDNLASVLNITHSEAAGIIKSQPNLLTLSSGTLANKLQKLSAAVPGLTTQCCQPTVKTSSACRNDTLSKAAQPPSAVENNRSYDVPLQQPTATAERNQMLQEVESDIDANISPSSVHRPSMQFVQVQVSAHQMQPCDSREAEAKLPGSLAMSTNCSLERQSTRNDHDVCEVLIEAWQKQFSSAPPRAIAAYTCFSDQRYARLQKLVNAVSGMYHASDPEAQERFKAGLQKLAHKQWALSRVLRVSDGDFNTWLSGAHRMLSA